MPHRPSGVTVLGTFMIILGVITIICEFLFVWPGLPYIPVIIYEIPVLVGENLQSNIPIFILGSTLLAGAVGLLSMTGWGYYLALTSSIILIADSAISFLLFIASHFLILYLA